MPRREGIWTSKKISNIAKVVFFNSQKVDSLHCLLWSLPDLPWQHPHCVLQPLPGRVQGHQACHCHWSVREDTQQIDITCILRTSAAGWRHHDPTVLGGGVPQAVQGDKAGDPDLDNLTNPHEVKHWVDPKIIPFGWGLFGEQDEIIVIETGKEEAEITSK